MKNNLILLFFFFQVVNLTYSQNTNSIDNKYQIDSKFLHEEREIWVSLPNNYDSTKSYPTIYVLDAETHFDISYALSKDLAEHDKIPEHIVIGIPHIDNQHRFKDLSFTKNDYDADGELDSIVAQYFNEEKTGGGSMFYSYLKDEVMPLVNSTYSTNGFDVLVGHSLGGYFGAYIITMDSPFNAYQLYDPSVWYNHAEPAKHFSKTITDNVTANVFISTANGGKERQQYNVDSQKEFNDLLRQNNINSELIVYDNENHGSVKLPSFIDGFSNLYSGYAIGLILTTDTIKVAGVQKHYSDFSNKVKYNFSPTVEAFRWTGYVNHYQRNWTDAIDAYKLCTILYKTDSYMLMEFADCYFQTGEFQESLNIYEKAHTIDPNNESIELKIEELKSLIEKSK